MAKPPHGAESPAEHGYLPQLDPDVEKQKRGNQFAAGDIQFQKHIGKAHAMQQPEEENHRQPGFAQVGAQNVLQPDIDNGKGYERLDQTRWKSENIQRGHGQGDGVGEGETGYLGQQGLPPDGQQKEPGDKEDVVQPAR